jgi:hypothetical protein
MRTTLLCCALLLVAGCGKKGSESAPAGGAAPDPGAGAAAGTGEALDPAPTAEAGGVAPALERVPERQTGDLPVVELVEAGAEPRKELRFALEQGQRFTAEMRMKMGMKIRMNGVEAPSVPLPETRTLMDLEVTSAGDDGYEYRFAFTAFEPLPTPGTVPEVVEMMREQLSSMVGATGSGRLDARGFNLGTEFNIPPGADPQMRQILDGMRDAISQMSTPLPEEPVGVGGKWKTTMRTTMNGMTSDLTYAYEVTGFEDSRVETTATIETAGVPGKVESPTLPPGATMTLNRMTGSGKGTMTIDLESLVPTGSVVSLDSNSDVELEMEGEKQRIEMEMSIEMRFGQPD